MWQGIIGGLGVASGMAIFVAVSPPAAGASAPGLVAWVPTLAGMAVGILGGLFGQSAFNAGPRR
jgi:hypothetical protein